MRRPTKPPPTGDAGEPRRRGPKPKPVELQHVTKTFSIAPGEWRAVQAWIPAGERSALIQGWLRREVRRRQRKREEAAAAAGQPALPDAAAAPETEEAEGGTNNGQQQRAAA